MSKSMYGIMYTIAESKNIDIVNCGYFLESVKKVEKLTSGFRKNVVLNHSDIIQAVQHPENGLQDFWFSCLIFIRESYWKTIRCSLTRLRSMVKM